MKNITSVLLLVCLALILSSCQSTDTSSESKDKSLNSILNDISDKYAVINYGSDSNEINVDVQDTEKATKVKSEIERELKENNLDHYKVNVREKNIDQVKKEERWFKIENKALANLQNNKEYEDVTMKKTDVDLNKPVTFTLSAPISINDDNAEEYARQIKKNVNEFLQSKDLKKMVNGNSYKIVIYDKEDNLINI